MAIEVDGKRLETDEDGYTTLSMSIRSEENVPIVLTGAHLGDRLVDPDQVRFAAASTAIVVAVDRRGGGSRLARRAQSTVVGGSGDLRHGTPFPARPVRTGTDDLRERLLIHGME